MRIRKAFTMLELIFVIVIMGIIGKFGTEFLAQSYKSFIFSSVNNVLQSNSATAVEFIAARLQYRIKDSVIARTGETTAFTPLADADGTTFTVIEWVSADTDNFRGSTSPNWSGIIDLNHADAAVNTLVSPATDTNAINSLIGRLSHGTGTSINDAALHFIGANTDINGYGWDGNALTDQNGSVMHPIKAVGGEPTHFTSSNGDDFDTVEVYEYYKLAWTANAVVMEDYNTTSKMGNLVFYYDYQPWNGEWFYKTGQNIKSFTIMKQVSTFQSMAIGSIIKIQVCSKSTIINGDENSTEGYSLCKEKTIF